MTEKLALYFGCVGDSGHFLWDPRDMSSRLRPPRDVQDFPWTMGQLDHDLLDRRGLRRFGKVAWLVGGRPVAWHAFLWWDRSVDRRPGSNSGFYVRGFEPRREDAAPAFEYAKAVWPGVVERQLFPLVLDASDPECVPPSEIIGTLTG
jgi:hypothetical protein